MLQILSVRERERERGLEGEDKLTNKKEDKIK
jgi:hypothetical protein